MPSQPNILYIMADQHRFDYLGSMGATFLRTPHLDRLAARGMQLTHCVTNSPICVPARISLATGLQPFRLGALDNNCYLPHTVPTHYQHFRDHSYRVGCVGKLDLAKPDHYNGRYGDRPAAYMWGFTHPEECEGKMHAGSSAIPLGPYMFYLQERGLLQRFHDDYRARKARGWVLGAAHDSVLPADAFEDAYIGRRASEWIRWVPDDFPWYYFVSFVGPHLPFDPPTEYAERYRHAEMPEPIQDSLADKPAWVQQKRVVKSNSAEEAEEVTRTRRQYCAAIEAIDDQVGQILAALDDRGLAQNTYVVYSSDHGEMLGDHGLYAKSVAYEPSLRVPLLVAGPGIKPGGVTDALIELADINPTLAQLAGLPPQNGLDARSFASLLRGECGRHRTEVISTFRNFQCVRTRDHKYIRNCGDIAELYDLQADPHELHSLASESPKLVSELSARLFARTVDGKWLR